MKIQAIRTTLKAGSIVFGASALFLLIAPTLFLDLLGLDSNEPMVWSMRMIAIPLWHLLAICGTTQRTVQNMVLATLQR